MVGAPRSRVGPVGLAEYVLRDAETLVGGGVHGLLLENYGDAPFFPRRVGTG